MIYSIFFQQLIFGVLALLFTYAVGKIIVSFYAFKGDYFFRLFVTTIIGITTIVVIYSLLKSQGKTINILLLPIIGYILYLNRTSVQKPSIDLKETVNDCMWLIVVFCLFFLYQSWFYFDFVKREIKQLYVDYYWYGSITDSLKLWGAETQFTEMNYFFKTFRYGMVPYHYFELWYTAFFSQYLHISSLNSYYFITTTFLSSVFFIGIIQLFSKLIVNMKIAVPITIVLLLISGIHFPFLDHIEWFRNSFLYSDRSILSLAASKSLIVLIFILLFYHLFKQGLVQTAFIILICIPVLSFTFLPMIYGGISLYLVISYAVKKFKIERVDLYIFLTVLLYLLSIMLFYTIFKSGYTGDYALTQIIKMGVFKGIIVTDTLFTIHNIKVLISNFLFYSIPYIISCIAVIVVLYGPFLLLGYKHIRTNISIWILLLCMLICGCVGTVFTKGLQDSIQFTSNFCGILVVFCIIAIVESLPSLRTKPLGIKFVLISFFLFSISNSYSIKKAIVFRNNARFLLSNNKRMIPEIAKNAFTDCSVVAIFLSQNDYNSRSFINWYEVNDLFPLNQISNGSIVFTVLNPELLKNTKRTLSYDETSYWHFYTPITVWQDKDHDLKRFIELYKIKYFYFKAGVNIPVFIKNTTEKAIVSTTSHNLFLKTK